MKCAPLETTEVIDNGAGEIPWVKTLIRYVGKDNMAEFVCSHDYWLDVEVCANVPDAKPAY